MVNKQTLFMALTAIFSCRAIEQNAVVNGWNPIRAEILREQPNGPMIPLRKMAGSNLPLVHLAHVCARQPALGILTNQDDSIHAFLEQRTHVNILEANYIESASELDRGWQRGRARDIPGTSAYLSGVLTTFSPQTLAHEYTFLSKSFDKDEVAAPQVMYQLAINEVRTRHQANPTKPHSLNVIETFGQTAHPSDPERRLTIYGRNEMVAALRTVFPNLPHTGQ